MKKWILIDLVVFLLLGILSLTFAPDVFSLLVICAMCVLIAIAFGRGIWMVLNLAEGFRIATKYVGAVKEVTSASKWVTFRQAELIFRNKLLDSLWNEYREIQEKEQAEELIGTDIEEIINEDVLALHSWKAVVLQIPGTLTALGLIGTFLGLILGISGIAFSSVDAAISSITMLLAGIETAFYTSIIGVIFSMVFNISYKFAWNTLLREMGIFMTEFHKHIVPYEERQKKQVDREDMDKILECLERIPKSGDLRFDPLTYGAETPGEDNETALMSEIWEGLKNEDFIFYIQPRCDLNTKTVTGGEALMRWNHSRLGIVSPTVFLPTLERNGYIVKLDCRMWEDVCKTIRRWIDTGIRPVPISVNISKMDILVMDVAAFFAEMVAKYRIPPQYIQLEIAENAYSQSFEMAHEAETKLRQEGFHVIINGAAGGYDTMTLLADTQADAFKMEYQVLEKKQKEDSQALSEIVELGHKVRVKLIASGIENAKQLTTLRKAGFTEGQGFFLYKPVDINSFEVLLEEKN